MAVIFFMPLLLVEFHGLEITVDPALWFAVVVYLEKRLELMKGQVFGQKLYYIEHLFPDGFRKWLFPFMMLI